MDMGKRFWVSFVFLAAFIGVVAYFRQSNYAPAVELRQTIRRAVYQTIVVPTPTPYPYEDLTIPYLRQQTYKSTLSDFKQIDQNAYYTSYLTSYTSDGLKIKGLLTIPTGTPPDGGWPAIVFVHGYIPPKDYTTLSRYVDYVDYLARNGFVVFKIDLRGNGDSEGQPAGAYYSSGYVKDTLNAYAALQEAHVASDSATPTPNPTDVSGQQALQALQINPNKIGLWGHSMAGNIVMRAWATKPDIPAVVIWSGAGYTYEDLMKYKLNDPSFVPPPDATNSANFRLKAQLQKMYGKPDLNNHFWHDLAPVSFLTDLKGAIQIDQSQDDTVVNIGYNRDLMKLFDKTTVPHEMFEYPIGGHNIEGPSFDQAMQHTMEFYKKYLE